MRPAHFFASFVALLLAALSLLANGSAFADPPPHAARLAYLSGDVSFAPTGDGRWVRARVNRPLTIGDRLWTDQGSRAEVQVGGVALRMDEYTSVEILNLTDSLVQVQVDEGVLDVRTRRLRARQSVEVATPNLAFTAKGTGSYRIEADPSDDTTAIVVRSGRGEVHGDRTSYGVDSRQAYRFGGTGLRSYSYFAAPRPGAFDRWANARERRANASASARNVSRDVIGYEDLDGHGTWRNEPGYGKVWSPSRVARDWTPFRDGHWAWVEPWGWSWVDDAPWGYAVSHYGRWVNVRDQWAWVPGPTTSQAVYAPAVVGFVGGSDLQSSQPGTGSVGWFPLGPREVYRPSYQASRGYFENINRSNTTASNATISSAYDNASPTGLLMNQQVQGAIVAVLASVFAQSRPVAKAAVPVSQSAALASVAVAAPTIAPTRQSVAGAAPAAKAQPPERARERRIVAQSALPEAPMRFAPRQDPAAKPGSAPAPAAAAAPKPSVPAPAKSVVVAAQATATTPSAAPPEKAPEGKPAAKSDDAKPSAAATLPVAPAPTPSPATKQAPATPAAETKPDTPDVKAAKRKGDERKVEDRKPPEIAAAPSAPAVAPAPVAAGTPKPAVPAPEVKPAAKSDDAKPSAAATAPVAPAPTPSPAAKPAPAAPTPLAQAVAAPQKAAPAAAEKSDAANKRDGRRKGDAKRDDRKQVEKRRAEEDRRRASEDSRRAQEDKRRAAEDRSRAEKGTKRPDADKKRADEDKKRLEEDKRRADEDRTRASEDKQRAEEDKKS